MIGSEKLVDPFHLDFEDEKVPYKDADPTEQNVFSPHDWEVVTSFERIIRSFEKAPD